MSAGRRSDPPAIEQVGAEPERLAPGPWSRPRRAGRRHPLLRFIASSTTLIFIGILMGLVLAGSLGGLIWLLAAALHHAASN